MCAFCVCENIRMMASERSKSQRQEWVCLSEHYSQFLHHYRYLVTQLIHMHIDLLLNSSERCGRSSQKRSAQKHFKRKQRDFCSTRSYIRRENTITRYRPHENHFQLSSCSEGTNQANATGSEGNMHMQEKLYIAIHVCVCELINMMVCETLMIYICMIGSTRNSIYIYA